MAGSTKTVLVIVAHAGAIGHSEERSDEESRSSSLALRDSSSAFGGLRMTGRGT